MTTRHEVTNAFQIHIEIFHLAEPKSSLIRARFFLGFNLLALANFLWLQHCDQTLNHFLSKSQALKQFKHLISANHQRFYVKLAHSICLKLMVLIYYVREVARRSAQVFPNFGAIITSPTMGGGS